MDTSPTSKSSSKSSAKVVTTTVSTTTPKKNRRRGAPTQNQTKTTVVQTKVQPPSGRRVNAAAASLNRRARLTKAGRAWLRLYLNPMGRDDPGIIGYPDGAATRSVLGDYREDFNFVVPPQSSVFITGAAPVAVTKAKYDAFLEGPTVSICFFQIPTIKHAMFVRIYASTPTKYVSTAGMVNSPTNFPNYYAFQSSGATTKPEDDIGFLQTTIALDRLGEHADMSYSCRLVARANTFIYTVPKLEEEGFVISAQFEPMFHSIFSVTKVKSDAKDVAVLGAHQYAMRHANITPHALTECFHNAYTSKCSDGAYVPIYNTVKDLRYIMSYDRDIEFISEDESVQGDGLINDTPLEGWNAAVTWFTGVSKNCSIFIKHRSVMQYVPAPGSVIANFTRQEPDEDRVALELAWTMRNHLSPAYPSCYNDWGWLGDFVDKWLSGMPYVGAAYNTVKPFIKPAWDWVGDQTRNFVGL